MSRTLAVVVTAVMVFAVALPAMAGIPDPDNSRVELVTTSPATKDGLATCPIGDGPAYKYIKVIVQDSTPSPIAEVPSASVYFVFTGGECTPTCVSVPPETDSNGEILFELVGDERIVGYSNGIDSTSPALTVECQVYTVVLNDSDLLDCNSLDVNNDLKVGGQDGAYFSTDFGTSNNERCDWNWDNVVGGQDGAYYSTHFGHDAN